MIWTTLSESLNFFYFEVPTNFLRVWNCHFFLGLKLPVFTVCDRVFSTDPLFFNISKRSNANYLWNSKSFKGKLIVFFYKGLFIFVSTISWLGFLPLNFLIESSKLMVASIICYRSIKMFYWTPKEMLSNCILKLSIATYTNGQKKAQI